MEYLIYGKITESGKNILSTMKSPGTDEFYESFKEN